MWNRPAAGAPKFWSILVILIIKLNLGSKKALVFDIKSVHGIMINLKKFIYVENVNDQITKHVL